MTDNYQEAANKAALLAEQRTADFPEQYRFIAKQLFFEGYMSRYREVGG